MERGWGGFGAGRRVWDLCPQGAGMAWPSSAGVQALNKWLSAGCDNVPMAGCSPCCLHTFEGAMENLGLVAPRLLFSSGAWGAARHVLGPQSRAPLWGP